MKSILLAACLIAAAPSFAFAQSAAGVSGGATNTRGRDGVSLNIDLSAIGSGAAGGAGTSTNLNAQTSGSAAGTGRMGTGPSSPVGAGTR